MSLISNKIVQQDPLLLACFDWSLQKIFDFLSFVTGIFKFMFFTGVFGQPRSHDYLGTRTNVRKEK